MRHPMHGGRSSRRPDGAARLIVPRRTPPVTGVGDAGQLGVNFALQFGWDLMKSALAWALILPPRISRSRRLGRLPISWRPLSVSSRLLNSRRVRRFVQPAMIFALL